MTIEEWAVVPLKLRTDLERGGRWTSLRAGAREWLWTNPDPLIRQARTEVVPAAAFADAGGVEECVPTVRGRPDHGDAWSRPWSCSGATASVDLPGLGTLQRTVAGGDSIEIDYRLTGAPGTRFLHAVHMLIDVGETARLVAPGVSRALLLDGPDRSRPWPDGLDVLGPDDGTATCALLAGCREAMIVDGEEALRLVWDAPAAAEHCSLLLWRNLRGWPAHAPYRSIGIEPMVGRAADLERADHRDLVRLGRDGRFDWSLHLTALHDSRSQALEIDHPSTISTGERTPTMTATIPDNPTVELVDSTPLLGRPTELLTRADADGYLFFRGLLNRDRVLDLRRRMMDVVAAHGWLEAGTNPMDGIADVEAFDRVDATAAAFCGTGVPIDAYRDIYRIQEFHAIGHDPALLSLYATLLGGDVIRQPLSIARIMIPGTKFVPTPAHQDFIHIQGTKNVWTAWFPLGDCPIELGGLTVLVGSQADGLLTYHAATGAGELEAYICESGHPWGIVDYEAGDVLTFNSLTVHRGTPNRRGDRVRLSVDMRYQRADEPITSLSTLPHCQILSWDEVYEAWTEDSLKYYWRSRDLSEVPHDENLRWQKHKIC